MNDSQNQDKIQRKEVTQMTTSRSNQQHEHPPLGVPPTKGGQPGKGKNSRQVDGSDSDSDSEGDSPRVHTQAPQHPTEGGDPLAQAPGAPPEMQSQAQGNQPQENPHAPGHPPPHMNAQMPSYPQQIYPQDQGQPKRWAPEGFTHPTQMHYPPPPPYHYPQTGAYPPSGYPPQGFPQTQVYPPSPQGFQQPQVVPPTLQIVHMPTTEQPTQTGKGEWGRQERVTCCKSCCATLCILCVAGVIFRLVNEYATRSVVKND